MSQPDFTIEYLDPRTLGENPFQFRRHPDSQKAAVQASLKEFGWVDGPLLNKRTGNLIDGHLRREEAIAQGRETIPVKVVDLSEADERRLLRMFDPLTMMATEDSEALERLIAQIGDPDLERLLGEMESTSGSLLEGADPDAIPEAVETRCQPGDLWRLGEHRLLCGDSTVSTDVERLMGDETPQMVFADPPYGISLTSDRSQLVRKKTTDEWKNKPKNYEPITGDDQPFDWRAFDWLEVKEQFWWGADYYAKTLPDGGSWFVWDKRVHESLDPMIGSSFELCWSRTQHRREIIRAVWIGFQGTETQDTRARVHPTQKPVQLCSWFIDRFADEGEVVLDPFLGSGTSIVAGEKSGRRVFGVELHPPYADLCIQRWETATGKKAELLA